MPRWLGCGRYTPQLCLGYLSNDSIRGRGSITRYAVVLSDVPRYTLPSQALRSEGKEQAR